jgi:hypothetical protein
VNFGFWNPFLAPMWAIAFWEASVRHLTVLHFAAFFLLAIQVMMIGLSVHHLRRFHRAAGDFLGIRVGWNEPPSDEKEFTAWCESKGVKPQPSQ